MVVRGKGAPSKRRIPDPVVKCTEASACTQGTGMWTSLDIMRKPGEGKNNRATLGGVDTLFSDPHLPG